MRQADNNLHVIDNTTNDQVSQIVMEFSLFLELGVHQVSIVSQALG